MPSIMRAYWQDGDDIVHSTHPRTLTLNEALDRWADGSAVEGNFFGLVDAAEDTIQFYFEESIPDDIEDAGHLRIVLLDFPVPELAGSFQRRVTIEEAAELIRQAYEKGASHENFDSLSFSKW